MTAESAAPKANLRWMLDFMSPYRWQAAAALFFGMLAGATVALEPYIIGLIVDNISQGVDMGVIIRDIGILLGLVVITAGATLGQWRFSGMVAYGVLRDIRARLFANMVTLDNDFYEHYPTGDLISRMFSDTNWVWRLLALAFNRAGGALAGLVLTVIILGTISPALTLVVFVVIAVGTAFQIRAGLVLTELLERVQDQEGNLSALVQDAVSGIQTVKSFGRERELNAAFKEENLEFRRRWLYFKRRNEPVGMLPQMVIHLTAGVIVIVGGVLTLNNQITLGNFTQFLLYLTLINLVLLRLGTTYQRYMQTRGALRRLTPLLQPTAIADREEPRPLPEARGDIVFENAGLKAGDRWILRNIDLIIPGGSVVALVGPTGSGMTTLVNLIARVTDVDEGRILIGGRDIRDLKLADLRRSVAYVPQTTFLFSQPLHENVRMGKPELSEPELAAAVRISRLGKDLVQMPDGLDTLVGEKGVMLSGGQKQRVAIARAVAHDPDILVLDDALSSVDTNTAAQILQELRDVLKTRTSIIIAHRIATVKDADYVIVMEDGQIVEQGTHDDLAEAGGLYASMVERELNEEAIIYGD
ncbi:MAG: ABC transporter ATP-binding protein [Anaerolineae bacterium]